MVRSFMELKFTLKRATNISNKCIIFYLQIMKCALSFHLAVMYAFEML